MPAIAPAHGKVNSLSAAMLIFYCKPYFLVKLCLCFRMPLIIGASDCL